jgi:hypothetical protein
MSLEITKRKKVINWEQLYSTIDCITNTYKSSINKKCIECQMSHQIEKKNVGNWGQLCSTIDASPTLECQNLIATCKVKTKIPHIKL